MDKQMHKDILLNTFKTFVSFCNENGLKYVAAYGTVLGAVRHNGMIPWDDDIDVFMERNDYNKFIALKDKLSSSKYEIIDLNNDGYYLPFAKFCNKETSIIENKNIPFVIGVFIDIFPLDKVTNDTNKACKLYKQFRRKWTLYSSSLYRFSIKEILLLLSQKKIKFLFALLFGHLRSTVAKAKFLSFFDNLSRNDGQVLIDYTGSKFWLHPCDIVSNSIEVSFEHIKINIPFNYDDYLTRTYGNWRELPPLEKRVSHPQFYMNLDKRININEIFTY